MRNNTALNDEQKRLITENTDLVEKVRKKFCGVAADDDDITGAAMEELCNAALRYDPEKNVGFRTFALKTMTENVKHQLRNLVPQYVDSEGKTVFVTVVSIDSLVCNNDDLNDDEMTGEDVIPAENQNDVESREVTHERFEMLMKGLTKKERKMILAKYEFRDQKSIAQMAREMGISERTLYKKIEMIEMKLARKGALGCACPARG